MKITRKAEYQKRSLQTQLRAKDSSDDLIIEGYFVVFNRETELFPGAFEEIAPEAISDLDGQDIRCLNNHDTQLVLGRTKSGTLDLRKDEKGLWGSVKINPDDTDAVNLYQRVKRGDVDQCSFGFEIVKEDVEHRDDGGIKWTIRDIILHEVSIVTFPAYSDTGVQARQKDKARMLEARKLKLKERLKNVKTT